MDQKQTGKLVLAVAAAGMLVAQGTPALASTVALPSKAKKAVKKKTVITTQPGNRHTYSSGKKVTYKLKAKGSKVRYRWYLKLKGGSWKRVSSTSTFKFKISAKYNNSKVSGSAQAAGRLLTWNKMVSIKVRGAGTTSASDGDQIVLGAKILGDDYKWGSKTKYSMSKLSPLRYYYRYCTDFVAWRLNKQAGTTNGNYKWTWANLTPRGGNANKWPNYWPKNSTPQLGAVAWWKPGHGSTLGHVAIVSAIYADGSITVEEYNWTNRGGYGVRTLKPSDRFYPDAFMHIQDWKD